MVEDGPVRASKVLEEVEKGVENEVDGAGADPDEGGAGDGDDVVVVEILGRSSTGAMRKLDNDTATRRLGQHICWVVMVIWEENVPWLRASRPGHRPGLCRCSLCCEEGGGSASKERGGPMSSHDGVLRCRPCRRLPGLPEPRSTGFSAQLEARCCWSNSSNLRWVEVR